MEQLLPTAWKTSDLQARHTPSYSGRNTGACCQRARHPISHMGLCQEGWNAWLRALLKLEGTQDPSQANFRGLLKIEVFYNENATLQIF